MRRALRQRTADIITVWRGATTLGWFFLCLLAVLLILLFCPVGLEVIYSGSLTVRARLLGVPLRLVPAKEKKKKRRVKAKKEPPEPKPEAEPQKQSVPLMDILALINDLLPEVGRLLGHTLRHLTVKRLRVRMPVSGEDAAQTGIHYGQMSVLCYNIYVYLASAVRLREWTVALLPDFSGEHPAELYTELYIKASPAVLIWGVLRFLAKGGLELWNSAAIQQMLGSRSKNKKSKTKNKIKSKKKEGA